MIRDFYSVQRDVERRKETLTMLTEDQFQLLKEHGFDYESVEQDHRYQLNEKHIDITIDSMQFELEQVRRWNHKKDRKILLHVYECHMKRAGDFL